MPRVGRLLPLFVTASILSACGEGEVDGPDAGPSDIPIQTYEMGLGTGPERDADPDFEPRFEPVEPGEGILLRNGGQGPAYHAPIAIQIDDPSVPLPSPPRIRGEGRRRSDGLLVTRVVSNFTRFETNEAGLISDTPVRVTICPAPVGENLMGEVIDVTLRIEDDAGRVYGRGELGFEFDCPDDICETICAGE